MAHSKSGRMKINAAERRIKSIEMRKKGHTLTEIGDALGVTATTINNDIKFMLKEYNERSTEQIEQMRALENARIEHLIKSIWDEAIGDDVLKKYNDDGLVEYTSGQLKSMDRVIKLLERKAKLNGLDIPSKSESEDIAQSAIAAFRELAEKLPS